MHIPYTVITGAAGMIGSGVVRHLNDMGNSSLLLVDDLGSGDKWKNLVGKRFINIISRHKLLDFLKGREDEIDAILHLGACSDTTEANADYLLENNFRFSIDLASFALRANKRFVYASSAATYGSGALGFVDDENSLEELRPLNMYGYSKQLVDLWMKREGAFKSVVGLKYFNVFGPNEYHKGKMASFVLKMSDEIKKGHSLKLFQSNDIARFPDGEQRRDFLYVKDAVRMTCLFLQKQYAHVAGIYNIGSGLATSWNEKARYLLESLGKAPQVTYVAMPPELQGKYQNYTCADMRKFHNIFSTSFGEKNITPLKDAVREYVSEYLLRNDRW